MFYNGSSGRPWRPARLVSVMAKDWMATGWKLRMRGYRSMGDSVPLVMTTVWNFWNTGFTARLASRQLSCRAVSGFQGVWALGFQGEA